MVEVELDKSSKTMPKINQNPQNPRGRGSISYLHTTTAKTGHDKNFPCTWCLREEAAMRGRFARRILKWASRRNRRMRISYSFAWNSNCSANIVFFIFSGNLGFLSGQGFEDFFGWNDFPLVPETYSSGETRIHRTYQDNPPPGNLSIASQNTPDFHSKAPLSTRA